MSIISNGAPAEGINGAGQKEELTNKQEELLSILNSTTQLYLKMLRINLELKKLPTERAAVFNDGSETVM